MSRGSGKAISSQPSQLLQKTPCTWALGEVYYLQVAQGGEDVVSESKTEDSGYEEARTKPRHLTEQLS